MATPDPTIDTYLPVDDHAWDEGVRLHTCQCSIRCYN